MTRSRSPYESETQYFIKKDDNWNIGRKAYTFVSGSSDVVAMLGGEIVDIGNSLTQGNYVVVMSVVNGSEVFTRYSGLEGGSIKRANGKSLKIGELIRVGQQFASAGSIPNQSTISLLTVERFTGFNYQSRSLNLRSAIPIDFVRINNTSLNFTFDRYVSQNKPTAVNDFNGDGIGDVFLTRGNQNYYLTFDNGSVTGQKTFHNFSTEQTGFDYQKSVKGIFGTNDATGFVMEHASNGRVVLHNNQNGRLSSYKDVMQLDSDQDLVHEFDGDLNGDGITDLVIQDDSGLIQTIILDGNGNIAKVETFASISARYIPKLVADLDGDNDDDLIFEDIESNRIVVNFVEDGRRSGFATLVDDLPGNAELTGGANIDGDIGDELIFTHDFGSWERASAHHYNSNGQLVSTNVLRDYDANWNIKGFSATTGSSIENAILEYEPTGRFSAWNFGSNGRIASITSGFATQNDTDFV